MDRGVLSLCRTATSQKNHFLLSRWSSMFYRPLGPVQWKKTRLRLRYSQDLLLVGIMIHIVDRNRVWWLRGCALQTILDFPKLPGPL